MGGIDVHPWLIAVLAVLILAQAAWIFWDAGKRGEKRILWGLFGLLNVPSSLIVYLLVTRARTRGKVCPACGKRMERDARFCPACGAAQERNPPRS